MDLLKKRKLETNGCPLSPSDADKLLSPLTKDQLLPILRSALLLHPDVLESVRSIADSDPTQRKLFIRGLGWETTTESLRATFSLFGDIEEAIVITDKVLGKSKGYGFVTFRHVDGAVLALKEPNKKIDGRITVTQLAAAGNNSGGLGANDVSSRKIYVGNVPFDVSSERLLQFFSVFGEIEEGPLGFDKQTGKAKGFAFFVYKTEEGARASLYEPMKILDGHQLVCKLATDNKKVKSGGQAGMGGQTGMAGDDRMGARPMGGSNFGVPSGYSGFQGVPGPVSQQSGMVQSGGNGGPVYGSQGAGYPPGGYGPGPGQYGSGHGGAGTGGYGAGLGHPSGYRMPPSSTGMPPSGGYPDVGNYGQPTGYGSQMPQPGAGPRIPPGGMYQSMPPYY